jgi:CO dehydrogenase/acetyl-CoA synthase complex epsilon subunit
MIRRPVPWRPTARTEADNPILIAGPKVRHNKDLYDLVVSLSRKRKIPIFATGGSIKVFKENKVEAEQMSLLHAVNLMVDGDLQANKKKVDVALFVGTDYAIANNVFSTLKNWGDVKTVSISEEYQPNAAVSFANLNDEVFKEYLEVLKG